MIATAEQRSNGSEAAAAVRPANELETASFGYTRDGTSGRMIRESAARPGYDLELRDVVIAASQAAQK